MSTITEPAGYALIVPHFSQADRIEYVKGELENIQDMLDGEEDCKWIYLSLLEYTVALWGMEQRAPTVEETSNCRLWLSEARRLDPLREGWWSDLEKRLTA